MTHIPDEAVQAALAAWIHEDEYNDIRDEFLDDKDRQEDMRRAITAALPHLSTLSAIIAFSVDTSPKNSLNLSNLLRHSFISGFEAKGGTITEAINHWPDYNPEQCQAYERVVRALSAAPAQVGFDDADWFYRDIDPDDSGDTAYEAIVNQPEYSVHLIHSSYRGDSRYAFRAPTPNQNDDEALHFATETEAISEAHKRKTEIDALPAAPTMEAGK